MKIQNQRLLRVLPIFILLLLPLKEIILNPASLWGYAGAALTILVAVVMYTRFSPVLFSADDSGISISACKTGFYDPDFIAYNQISRVTSLSGQGVELELTGGEKIAINVPKKYKDAVISCIRNGMER